MFYIYISTHVYTKNLVLFVFQHQNILQENLTLKLFDTKLTTICSAVQWYYIQAR